MATLPTVQANSVAKVLEYAQRLGAGKAELLASVGWSEKDLVPGDRRVPFPAFVALYEEAARRTGDVHFGLHVGVSAHPRMFDVLGYAALSRETLGDAFDVVTRYLRVLQEGARIDVEIARGLASVSYSIEARVGPCRHEVEATLGIIWRFLQVATAEPIALEEVRLVHHPPAGTGEHRRVFGARTVAGARHNALLFDAAALRRPLVSADPALARVMARHLESVLSSLPEDGIVERVRREIGEALRGGVPALSESSRRLGLSARTLQRRLAEEGVTFERLVDDVRAELAVRYLGDRRLSLSDVAFLLGYADVGAFHRAHKRWTGNTPRHGRARR